MQELEIPHLEDELSTILQKVVTEKKINQDDIKKWPSYLVLIRNRLELIEKLSNVEEKVVHKDMETETHKKIKKIYERIIRHLNETFHEKPPFTIIRLAELILDPKNSGYALNNNKQILKYFNSLEKIILVSSSITDFPETTFSINLGLGVSQEVAVRKQNAVNVELVEIPWLKNGNAKSINNEVDNKSDDEKIKDKNIDDTVDEANTDIKENLLNTKLNDTEDMIISPPLKDQEKTPIDSESIKITKEIFLENERRDDNENSSNNDPEQTKKRAVTTNQENLMPTKKHKNIDEEDEDNMEISQTDITDT